jgi:hypothetical protein
LRGYRDEHSKTSGDGQIRKSKADRGAPRQTESGLCCGENSGRPLPEKAQTAGEPMRVDRKQRVLELLDATDGRLTYRDLEQIGYTAKRTSLKQMASRFKSDYRRHRDRGMTRTGSVLKIIGAQVREYVSPSTLVPYHEPYTQDLPAEVVDVDERGYTYDELAAIETRAAENNTRYFLALGEELPSRSLQGIGLAPWVHGRQEQPERTPFVPGWHSTPSAGTPEYERYMRRLAELHGKPYHGPRPAPRKEAWSTPRRPPPGESDVWFTKAGK